MKFKLECTDVEGTRITREFEKIFMPHILNEIKYFLLGCGFVIKGEIDEVPTEDY